MSITEMTGEVAVLKLATSWHTARLAEGNHVADRVDQLEVVARAVGDRGARLGGDLEALGSFGRRAHRDHVRKVAVERDRLQLVRKAARRSAVDVLEADVL